MGHYAKVLNGIVVNVIVAEQDFFDVFVDETPGSWIQTSYNTKGGVHYDPLTGKPSGGVALRGNYAGVGYTYDQKNDVFYAPQRYPSWTISAPSWTWTPPIPYPTDGKEYKWNESQLSWDEVIA
jgi:hypothetical protein